MTPLPMEDDLVNSGLLIKVTENCNLGIGINQIPQIPQIPTP